MIARRVLGVSEQIVACDPLLQRRARVFHHACVCVPGLAGSGKAAQGILNVARRVSENNRKLERCDRHSLFKMRAWCARMELMESLM